MTDHASRTAAVFSEALQSISPSWVSRYRITRRLLARDPLERLIPEKLVLEGLEQELSQRSNVTAPLVVLMNRGGHGDGARLASGMLPLLSNHWDEVSLVHVSFNTPERGLGALVRSVLTRTAAEHGIDAHAVAFNRPAQGLKLSAENVESLLGDASLVVSFASDGEAGLVPDEHLFARDSLLAASHLVVLSFPDPEGLVSELDHLQQVIDDEPNVDALRFWAQVMERPNSFEDLETSVLGAGGTAPKKLWQLIENARRRPYRILVEPLFRGRPAGAPLVCPGRAVLEASLGTSAVIRKIVPAGSRLVAVGKGLDA